jgi:hypothetical protein
LEEEESTGENAKGEGEHEGREKRRSGASERATNAGTAPDARGGRVVREMWRSRSACWRSPLRGEADCLFLWVCANGLLALAGTG